MINSMTLTSLSHSLSLPPSHAILNWFYKMVKIKSFPINIEICNASCGEASVAEFFPPFARWWKFKSHKLFGGTDIPRRLVAPKHMICGNDLFIHSVTALLSSLACDRQWTCSRELPNGSMKWKCVIVVIKALLWTLLIYSSLKELSELH